MKTPRILAFGGSLRRDSYNQKLAAIAATGSREAGVEVTVIALRDFALPVFDEDLESTGGMPEAAKRLKPFSANTMASSLLRRNTTAASPPR